MINHLVEVPVLDRYNPPKPQLPGMKFNQKVKGGTELLYQSYCVGQLSVRERMFDEKKQVYSSGVHGIIALMDWLKNKNGPEGVRYPMIFDGDTGYKPELTDFEILYTEGLYGIKGSPLGYHLTVLPEIVFTRKTLLEKCHENPLLARALSFTTRLYLVSKVINRETPPNIDDFELADFESRVALILMHSCDYPGYANNGWVVPEEYFEMADNVIRTLGRWDGPNIELSTEMLDLFVASKGDLMDSQQRFADFNPVVKVGQTEYCISDSDNADGWKK